MRGVLALVAQLTRAAPRVLYTADRPFILASQGLTTQVCPRRCAVTTSWEPSLVYLDGCIADTKITPTLYVQAVRLLRLRFIA